MKSFFYSLPLALMLTSCNSKDNASANSPASASSGLAANSAPATSADENSGLSGEFVKPLAKGAKAPKATPPSQPRNAADAELIQHLTPDRSSNWQPTTLAPSNIASDVGKAIASLHDTKGKIYVVVETPLGRGFLNQELKIQDNKHYNINYVVFEDRPKHSTIVANGKQKQEQIDGKWHPAVSLSKPLPDAGAPADKLASRWALDFTRMMWTGLTDSRDSWAPAISQWIQVTADYHVT